jgi:hypothetical protein
MSSRHLSPASRPVSGNVESGLRANCALSRAAALARPTPCRLDCRLHRARGATRSKPSREVVRGSGRSVGWVDESATGSVNFFARARLRPGRPPSRGRRTGRRRRPRDRDRLLDRRTQTAVFSRAPGLEEAWPPGLDFHLRRARSASRSKPSREAVRGSGRSAGSGDESATGSANFFCPWSRRASSTNRLPARSKRKMCK